MTNHLTIRSAQVLAVAAAVAALAAPAAALGGSSPGNATSDTIERYAAAHPFGAGVMNTIEVSDTFERYATAHPFGRGLVATRVSHRPRRTVVKPIVWPLIDDWFRDPSAQRPYRPAAKRTTAWIIDDWFRDPSAQRPYRPH